MANSPEEEDLNIQRKKSSSRVCIEISAYFPAN